MKSLEFENLSFSYKKETFVFKDFSFLIDNKNSSGYVSAILGPSGCGKTTLLKLILGIEKNYSGKIFTTPQRPIISYVPQETVLFEHLTPLQNARYFEKISNYSSKFNEKIFKQVSKILELDDILQNSRYVFKLSGGQRQRLALLRALSIKPDILLMDEPCIGLDAEVKKMFLHKLREIIVENDLLVLYVTHHKTEAQLVADEIIYLIIGRGSNAVTKAAKGNILDFMNTPPYLEAALTFGYPDLNILHCQCDGTNKIQPLNVNFVAQHSDNNFFLTFKPDTIQLTPQIGFTFEVIAQSPAYSLIKLKETGNILTIKTSQINQTKFLDEHFVNFSGAADKYGYDWMYLGSIDVFENKMSPNE